MRTNSTAYNKDPSLSEYYKRLGGTAASPRKKTIIEKVTETLTFDDDAPAPAKKTRRKTVTPNDIRDSTYVPCALTAFSWLTCRSRDDEPVFSALVKTPGKEIARRTSILASQIPIPPSPAVVTDAIDQQTRRIRSSISHAYDRTQVHETADAARDFLSSPLTVTILALLLEAYGLRGQILPNKLLTTIPAIGYIKPSPTPILVPDLFLLLESKFWAPFSLWSLTSLILPATISYFINLPLKAHPSHTYSTRQAALQSQNQLQFDPFIFSLAKGLTAYLVYANHFTLGGLFTHFTLATVNESILGGWFAIVLSSGLSAAVSLYEAVLKKQ